MNGTRSRHLMQNYNPIYSIKGVTLSYPDVSFSGEITNIIFLWQHYFFVLLLLIAGMVFQEFPKKRKCVRSIRFSQ